jgi:DNA-directed RNA polymerase subunit RPC12/RpoP
MNQITLEEYRCRKCGRLFYVDGMDRHPVDPGFRCPHGCDDGSERLRDIVAEMTETADGRVNDFGGIKDYKVVLSLSAAEFERSMGRAPEDQGEFDAWAMLVEDSLHDWIDWNVVCECVCEGMQNAGDEDE